MLAIETNCGISSSSKRGVCSSVLRFIRVTTVDRNSDESSTVVLDCGSHTLKAGFSGEDGDMTVSTVGATYVVSSLYLALCIFTIPPPIATSCAIAATSAATVLLLPLHQCCCTPSHCLTINAASTHASTPRVTLNN